MLSVTHTKKGNLGGGKKDLGGYTRRPGRTSVPITMNHEPDMTRLRVKERGAKSFLTGPCREEKIKSEIMAIGKTTPGSR